MEPHEQGTMNIFMNIIIGLVSGKSTGNHVVVPFQS